jgi:MFS family permease
MFGFDVAIITGAGPSLERHFGLSALELGSAFSSLLFGCVAGVALSGSLVDRFGRKPLMITVATVFGVTSAFTGLAPTLHTFLFARFLGGLAVGGVSLVAPMYVAEIAPPRLRGRLGASYQMAIVTGILLSYLINYLLRDVGPDAWRLMFYSGIVPSALYLGLVLRVPESPRYLVRSGRAQGLGNPPGGRPALARRRNSNRFTPPWRRAAAPSETCSHRGSALRCASASCWRSSYTCAASTPSSNTRRRSSDRRASTSKPHSSPLSLCGLRTFYSLWCRSGPSTRSGAGVSTSSVRLEWH